MAHDFDKLGMAESRVQQADLLALEFYRPDITTGMGLFLVSLRLAQPKRATPLLTGCPWGLHSLGLSINACMGCLRGVRHQGTCRNVDPW
jgi:hypothetical protein